jgi:hypothetical protein
MSDDPKRSTFALDTLLTVGAGLLLIRQGVTRRGALGAIDIALGVASLYRWLYADARPAPPQRQLLTTEAEPDKAVVNPETLAKTPFQSE